MFLLSNQNVLHFDLYYNSERSDKPKLLIPNSSLLNILNRSGATTALATINSVFALPLHTL